MCPNQKSSCNHFDMKFSQNCCCVEKKKDKNFNKKHVRECIENLRKKADYIESKLLEK
ncbi:MAG: hypothetical protein PVI26_06015 [Chitinispirillia bacterium]|jgi:hypothetical protein